MTGSRSPAFSPVQRPPRRRWWRLLVWLLVLAGLAAVAVVVLASVLWGYAWLQLDGTYLSALAEADDDETQVAGPRGTAPAGATTVLVTLTDPVDPTIPEEPALASAVGVVQAGGPRDGAAVLLLPTDLQITTERTLADVQLDRGLDGLVTAVVDYTGIHLDHAVQATTDALPGLLDARGAVEVCTAADRCQELTGQALEVVLAQSDDVDRVRVIAAVVRSLAAEADAVDAVRSPRSTLRTIDLVANEITTDVALRGTGLLDAAANLTEGDQLEVVTLPALRDPSTDELFVLPERAEVVFQHLREGTPVPPSDPDDDPVPLDGVSVAVLNGAGVQGLAARVEAVLGAAGFEVVGTGNAPPFGQEETTVTYAPGDDQVRAAAILLMETLDEGRLEALDQPPRFEGGAVDILVTAGHDLEALEGPDGEDGDDEVAAPPAAIEHTGGGALHREAAS